MDPIIDPFIRAQFLCRIKMLQDKGCDSNCDVDLLTTEELQIVYIDMLQKFEDMVDSNDHKTISVALCLVIDLLARKSNVDIDIDIRKEHKKILYSDNEVKLDECVKSYAIFVKIKIKDITDIPNQEDVINILDMLCTEDTLLQKYQNVRSLMPENMIV